MNSKERIISALNLQPVDRTPVWFMRQAGRHLPEYRKIAAKYSFWERCMDVDLCTEITLQPIKRYQKIDAAIVFHQESVFVKAGMHSSELTGVGSLKIGSTTYSVTETISGSGFLVGAGLNLDDTRYGITYYSDMGGDADSDMTFLYGGVVF